MKVIIVGGGASGLMAALTASERPDARVVLLERQARVGRKLLATGNGRCNLSNRNLTPKTITARTPYSANTRFRASARSRRLRGSARSAC